MIFGATAIDAAIGGILGHSQQIGGQRWQKGRILDAADIALARAEGLHTLTIARPGPDDVGEDVAARRLGAALTGCNVVALAASHGRVNLAAGSAGLLAFDTAMVARVNTVAEALTLATLPAGARVAAGDIIATIKVIPYAVAAADLAAAIAVAGSIRVQPFGKLAATLIQTRLPGVSAKLLAKTARVTEDRITSLGGTLVERPPCTHSIAALQEALVAAAHAAGPGDVLLIAGASATVDRGDVIPAALVAAGGEVERLGMPVDPGNLLCLGRLAGRPVIGLPGCARSPKRNGFDLVLEAIAAGLPVTAASIAAMGAGGLLPEAERPQPRAAAAGVPRLTGAIVLAAGQSRRMGSEHKLLAEWRGLPLIAHVVDAIAAAGLPPPIVVLGARADAVRAALSGRTAQCVIAADHAQGLAHSLRAGLAAAPGDWDAVLVCLGDMPRVDAALLAALAKADGDVVVPVWNGKRGNPVRWHRRLFPALMALEGDIGGKALLASLPTPPTEVAAPGDGTLEDIDTPAALAALRDRG
jgi:molybdenum cofactor cytidylyltransferase